MHVNLLWGIACLQKDAADGDADAVDTAVILEEVTIVPIELPEFHPPNCRKRDLYYDADVFKELDEYVFSVSTFPFFFFLFLSCMVNKHKNRGI